MNPVRRTQSNASAADGTSTRSSSEKSFACLRAPPASSMSRQPICRPIWSFGACAIGSQTCSSRCLDGSCQPRVGTATWRAAAPCRPASSGSGSVTIWRCFGGSTNAREPHPVLAVADHERRPARGRARSGRHYADRRHRTTWSPSSAVHGPRYRHGSPGQRLRSPRG